MNVKSFPITRMFITFLDTKESAQIRVLKIKVLESINLLLRLQKAWRFQNEYFYLRV